MPPFDISYKRYRRGIVQQISAKFTDSQIKQLPLAPVSLLPALGPGYAIHAVSASAFVRKTSGVYTIPSNDDSFYIGNEDLALTGYVGSLFDATHAIGAYGNLLPITGAGGNGFHGLLSGIENKPLQIVMTSGAAFTGGGPLNSLTVLVSYMVALI